MAVRTKVGWADLVETAGRHAARSGRPAWEVWLLEPGLHALAFHRLARWLVDAKLPFFARLAATWGRWVSGSDLHPGARIGRRCVILHGGVTVGDTTAVGDDCLLEPGVMLLGTAIAPAPEDPFEASLDAAFSNTRTHPSLGNRVVVEAGATVIGDVFLGNDVRVLAGAVVTRDVPDGGVALGVPGRVLTRAQARPDPDARAVQALAERLYHLEEQLQILTFNTQRLHGGPPRTRQSDQYGPIAAVEELIDGAGI